MRSLTILLVALLPIMAGAQALDGVSVYATGGKSVTNWHGQASLVALNIELQRSPSPRWDYGVIVSQMKIRQPRSWFGNDFGNGNENVSAIGSWLFIRRNFRLDDPRWSAFLEMSSGPMWADKRVPAATSHFNFASQGAAGVIFLPDSPMPVIVGYRLMHISNGGYSERNPGLNVSALMIGTQVRLRR